MDKIRIGTFIAQCRRERMITQEELAETLGVTGKSVSKWETGNCLPAASVYEPLCGILGITINELFAGQRIRDNDHKATADRNLMQMLKYQLYNLGDRSITFPEFDNALNRIAEFVTQLKTFPAKEDAVDFWAKETGASRSECEKAYDFYIRLFDADRKDGTSNA